MSEIVNKVGKIQRIFPEIGGMNHSMEVSGDHSS